MKLWRMVLLCVLLLAGSAGPVLAAEPGGGDIHFGPYTFTAGTTYSGDQMVMGSATVEKEAVIQGELLVLGPLDMAEGAKVDGSLMVFGPATLAGEVTGDVMVTGPLTLDSTAVVKGDVSVAGPLSRAEGSVVEGEIKSAEPGSRFIWGPGWSDGNKESPERPMWLTWLLKLGRAFVALLVFVLLALLVASVWPEQLARVSDTISAQPLESFGVGLLTGLGVLGVGLVLLITICLSPVALLAFLALALAMAMGWIALGRIVGERLLGAVQADKTPAPVGATVLGTFLLTLLGVLLNLVGFCLYAPVVYGLSMIGLGALVLTRGGSRPYQSRGTGYLPPIVPLAEPPVPPTPPAPPAEPAA